MCCPTLDRPTPRTKKLEEPRGGEAENVVQDVLVSLEKLQTVSVPRCLDERKPHLLEEGALKKNKRCAGGGARKSAISGFTRIQNFHLILCLTTWWSRLDELQAQSSMRPSLKLQEELSPV